MNLNNPFIDCLHTRIHAKLLGMRTVNVFIFSHGQSMTVGVNLSEPPVADTAVKIDMLLLRVNTTKAKTAAHLKQVWTDGAWEEVSEKKTITPACCCSCQ